MDKQGFQARTDAKLQFARIILEELKGLQHIRGDAFERAHEEAFLFHLVGVRDAMLAELAAVYGHVPPPMDRIDRLRAKLAKAGVVIPEIETLHKLAIDSGSWLRMAIDLRNMGTHDRGVGRNYSINLGASSEPNSVQLRHPVTRQLTTHFPDQFEIWLENMSTLVRNLRSSAPS